MTQAAAMDDGDDFVTEVTVILPSARRPTRDLRTRRISDTQVEYESFGPKNRDESLANTFSTTQYDDEAVAVGRMSRNTSVKGGISPHNVEDYFWRGLEVLPSDASTQPYDVTNKSPDVFVPTKRTIFTVQGGNRSRDQARATPTFVDFVESQEEEQEGGRSHWRRSQSHPDNVSEAVIQKSARSVSEKNSNENVNGHDSNISSRINKTKRVTKKSEVVTPAKAHQLATEKDQISVTDEPKKEVKNEELELKDISPQKENSQTMINNTKECNEIQDKLTEAEKPTTDAEEGATHVGKPPSHPPPPQPVTTAAINTAAITTARHQTPTPTSPPIESKRKVLEAVNEGIPAVRNIIQKFNQRITENQELLGSPFRSPPSSPPWQSPRSQRKLLADLNTYQAGVDYKSPKNNAKSSCPGSFPPVTVSPHGGVHKSQSASVIVSHPELPPRVQRSASGSCVQEEMSINSNVKINVSIGTALPQLSKLRGPSPGEAFNCSSSVSPAITPAQTDLDTSCDLECSTDDTGQPHERLVGASRPESRSPAAHIRALRIKKAKEEFLARGAGLPTIDQRSGNTNEIVKLRHRSGTTSTESSWRESDELCAEKPSPIPTAGNSQEREETREKPPRVASRRRNIPKKESFRRQSAGCLLEEAASPQHSSQVVKSSSSGVLAHVNKRHSRYSIDSQSPDRRKDSTDPSGEHTRAPLGIFRLFRRNRSKDKRDMPSVQRLCRQSLVVDFANGRGRTQSASPQPDLHALPEVEGEDNPEAITGSAKTLPRGSTLDAAPLAPSRSCPSSPVAPHRSRTANWLARGRQIFNSRSPSPGNKTR
ncbi:hypothetical protein GWK47_027753 [Chionoecetes opilio]|uniref:Uncharacterized protein n=1 Tax=Chionoecetes opilio TaxID=41210 RepID=A0A8J8WBH1_CHIOP|nr:hypothetical protein GWK47_027753 [Chionoecetes opilio]